jgi:hypothetical protein
MAVLAVVNSAVSNARGLVTASGGGPAACQAGVDGDVVPAYHLWLPTLGSQPFQQILCTCKSSS